VEHQLRAVSFGSAADDYARFRPAPPAEAAEWAVARATAGVVIDLAAGTGNLSRHLVGRVEKLVAIDIDPRMLSALGDRLPGVDRVAARGEQLPIGASTAAAVVISSAWHWLDPVRAWEELARVILPGGTFAIMWSGADRSVEWVADVLSPPGGETRTEGSRRRWQVDLPRGVPFSQVEERTFTSTIGYAVAELPRLAASYSHMIVLPPAEKALAMEAVAARASTRSELKAVKTVDLPLRCRVWRAVRE